MATIELIRNDPNVRTLLAGDTIFSEDDDGSDAFVVTAGEVELLVHGQPVEILKDGGIFGEMALIDHKTRSATARAITDVTLVPLDQKRFLYLVENTPYFAIEVMQVMADRLRRMDAIV